MHGNPNISAIAPESSAPLPADARRADAWDWLLVFVAMGLVLSLAAWASRKLR